ncbi:MAG: sulfotransferase, partial [Bradymonadaceae bacterium]
RSQLGNPPDFSRPLTPKRLRGIVAPNLHSPVFIVGAPRSGTSFLGNCIGALPNVSYYHEPVATKAATRVVWNGTWSVEEAERFFRLVFRLLLGLQLAGDLRFAQKTPRHAFIVDFLYKWFETPHFIHLIRDGRDAAYSYSQKPWLSARSPHKGFEPGGAKYGPHPRFWVEPDRRDEFCQTSDLHRCIWAWRRHVEAALDKLDAVPPELTLTVRYESLVRYPKFEARRILHFLDVTEGANRRAMHSALEAARTDSIGRGPRRLSDRQYTTIEAEAGDLLHKLDYF